jgi:hypothetical protein
MLSELEQVRLIDERLGSGSKQGYYFECAYSTTTSEFLWWATAKPQVPGSSGDRAFFTSAAGVIYWAPCRSSDDLEALPKIDPKTCEIPKGLMPVGRGW